MMRYVHAILFFIRESNRIRKDMKAGWFLYATEFPRMLWTFLRLEWEDERRHHGYAPVTVPRSHLHGFRQVGKRGKLVKKAKAKKKGKK